MTTSWSVPVPDSWKRLMVPSDRTPRKNM